MVNLLVSDLLAPQSTLAAMREKKFTIFHHQMCSLKPFTGTWHYKDILHEELLLTLKCLCLPEKISLPEKNTVRAQSQAHTTFYMPCGEIHNTQGEVEASGKVVMRKDFQESRLTKWTEFRQAKGKGKEEA